MNVKQLEALEILLDYNSDEAENYNEYPSENHIYHSIKILNQYVYTEKNKNNYKKWLKYA